MLNLFSSGREVAIALVEEDLLTDFLWLSTMPQLQQGLQHFYEVQGVPEAEVVKLFLYFNPVNQGLYPANT